MNKGRWSQERVAITWFIVGWLASCLVWGLTILLGRVG